VNSLVVLCGGTGAAKFLQGLQPLLAPGELTCIVNTGDDLVWWGLHVSPDLDSITYGLAGLLSRERGWGVDGDTFECAGRMSALGQPAWFSLGDRDLATHFYRTQRLGEGARLSDITAELAQRHGVTTRVLPMSNERVRTRVTTSKGELGFQEYFVRERHALPVSAVRFLGADAAQPAPGVLDAIAGASGIIIAPSNPITSIGPILAVPGIRQALRATRARIAAVSPIIGGKTIKGPADRMMASLGMEPSAAGVARAYADFLDVLVIDDIDAGLAPSVEASGVRAVVAPTIMHGQAEKRALAEAVLAAVQ